MAYPSGTPPGFRNFPQGDQRIMEYGVGEDVPIAGATGISHYVRRVSEEDLKKIPSAEEYKRRKEEEQRRVLEREDKLRPWAERWGRYMSGPTRERNARSIYKSLSGSLKNLPEDIQRDIDSIRYTEDPTIGMLEIDIDTNPININKLIEAGLRYAKTPSNDEVIDAVFKLFIAREEEKVRDAQGPRPRSMQDHIYAQHLTGSMSRRMMEKLPKIQTVLDQVRARLSIQSNLSNLSALPSKNGSKIKNLSSLYRAAPPPASQPLAPLQVPRPQSPGTANFGGRRKTYRRKNKKSKHSKSKNKSKAKRKV